MDINQIEGFNFDEFFTTNKKEESQQVNLYAKEKSIYLSWASYCVIALTVIAVILVSVLGLPAKNAVWWGIPIYLYTIGHIVALVFCNKNRKILKRTKDKKEYNNVATALFILSFMLSLSLMAMFIVKAVAPNIMLGV